MARAMHPRPRGAPSPGPQDAFGEANTMVSDADAVVSVEGTGLPWGWDGKFIEQRFGEGKKSVLELSREGRVKCRLSGWTSSADADIRQGLFVAARRWISVYGSRQDAACGPVAE